MKFVPARWRKGVNRVAVVRLQGVIGVGTPLRPGLTLHGVNDALERAFALPGVKAVALVVNSPGGSPVQSALITERIRQLSAEKNVPVLAFTEDVAASGGYWLVLSGDEIYADPTSIVGSIGVLSASFGFVEAIKKLGIERRVQTAGENKLILDPFQPKKKKDIDRLKEIQNDMHDVFKDAVRQHRGSKLDESNKDLFSGAFWTGRRALEMGLIDGLGHMHKILREKYGEDVDIKPISIAKKGLLGRFMPGMDDGAFALGDLKDGWSEDLVSSLEARSIWARFGF
ncbi:MAG: S49 family peptidase [Hyphomicrobiales bacterium]